MTPSTLKALKASIAHWRRLATGKRRLFERPAAEDCALCAKFCRQLVNQWGRISGTCDGCPVKNRTGRNTCLGTPYKAARNKWLIYGADSPEFKAAAKEELEFLESLLPKTTILESLLPKTTKKKS